MHHHDLVTTRHNISAGRSHLEAIVSAIRNPRCAGESAQGSTVHPGRYSAQEGREAAVSMQRTSHIERSSGLGRIPPSIIIFATRCAGHHKVRRTRRRVWVQTGRPRVDCLAVRVLDFEHGRLLNYGHYNCWRVIAVLD
jgi:hypothetical protein